jgi:hypothetical protein
LKSLLNIAPTLLHIAHSDASKSQCYMVELEETPDNVVENRMALDALIREAMQNDLIEVDHFQEALDRMGPNAAPPAQATPITRTAPGSSDLTIPNMRRAKQNSLDGLLWTTGLNSEYYHMDRTVPFAPDPLGTFGTLTPLAPHELSAPDAPRALDVIVFLESLASTYLTL